MAADWAAIFLLMGVDNYLTWKPSSARIGIGLS